MADQIPEEAIKAAVEAVAADLIAWNGEYEWLKIAVGAAVEAAAPAIREAERERMLSAAQALEIINYQPGYGTVGSGLIPWDKLADLIRSQP